MKVKKGEVFICSDLRGKRGEKGEGRGEQNVPLALFLASCSGVRFATPRLLGPAVFFFLFAAGPLSSVSPLGLSVAAAAAASRLPKPVLLTTVAGESAPGLGRAASSAPEAMAGSLPLALLPLPSPFLSLPYRCVCASGACRCRGGRVVEKKKITPLPEQGEGLLSISVSSACARPTVVDVGRKGW